MKKKLKPYNKKTVVIRCVTIALAFVLLGYVSYCLGGSQSAADILSENGGADKFENVDTLKHAGTTFEVFAKTVDDGNGSSELLVFCNPKCFGIDIKNRYSYYANASYPKDEVGTFFIKCTGDDGADGWAAYLYSLNTVKLAKVSCTYTYKGLEKTEEFEVSPSNCFVKRIDLSADYSKIYTVTGYDSDGNEVYSRQLNDK